MPEAAHQPVTSGNPQDPGDRTSCDYWRYCAIDGFLCTCCGGSVNACPPGTEMSRSPGSARTNPPTTAPISSATTTVAGFRPAASACATATKATVRSAAAVEQRLQLVHRRAEQRL
jgi:hypothetical protein